MRKNFRDKMISCVLAFAVILCAFPVAAPAQESKGYSEDKAISLSSVNSITLDTEGASVRLYGENKSYSIPVKISADSTVILDNLTNNADITVANGTTARILLLGKNVIGNILAEGGDTTTVSIERADEEGCLSAGKVACSTGGTTGIGANVQVIGCKLSCDQLGSGNDGADKTYWSSYYYAPSASPGSNASPHILISSAQVEVNGNVGCGGDGATGRGTSASCASKGGTSGEVTISNSQVTVTGNMAVGGKGGVGVLGNYACQAGSTETSSPVTITNGSTVTVSGKVASQQDLPNCSNGSTVFGMDGVTVTVLDSSLSASDIASGGNGYMQVSGTYGTSGGDGGNLIAKNSAITCETAVCGGIGGYYTNSADAVQNHPVDGDGGSIQAEYSSFTITGQAAGRGRAWDGYSNESVYQNSSFIGGSLNGIVYGDVITTDLTTLTDGDFLAADIRNSLGESCAKVRLLAGGELAGQCVTATANQLCNSMALDADGAVVTCLAVGSEKLILKGTKTYVGTFAVREGESDADIPVYELDPIGFLDISRGDGTIDNSSYSYQGSTFDYNGAYQICGTATQAAITVTDGKHELTLKDTSLGTLVIEGFSNVTLHIEGQVRIHSIQVSKYAHLTVEDHGQLKKDPFAFLVAECQGTLINSEGQSMYPVRILFEQNREYEMELGDVTATVQPDTEKMLYLLLAEGAYDMKLSNGLFCYRTNFNLTSAVTLRQQDMALYMDCSNGEIVILDEMVVQNGIQFPTNANIWLTQSGTANPVYVEKKDAVIILDDVGDDFSIVLPDDFAGTVQTAADLVPADTTDAAITTEPAITTDAAITTKPAIITDATSTAVATKPAVTVEQTATKTAITTHAAVATKAAIATRAAIATKPAVTTTAAVTSNSAIVSAAAATSGEAVTQKPQLQLTASVCGMKLLAVKAKNTYKIYAKKSLTLTVSMETNTEYYFKVVKKGQANSTVQWQRLTSDTLTVSDSGKQRIFLKAVNDLGTTIKKTSGFVIDSKKPVVSGVGNAALYSKKRSIRVTDNVGVDSVTLNGKQVKNSFSLSKKGIYLLKAKDLSGNSRTVLFAIL